ncbi:MAG: DUF892 family protein [Ktedonobacteraceae bacterium]
MEPATISKNLFYQLYKGLISKATLMGQQQVAQLLQQNLQQEEAMAKRVEQISQNLGQRMLQQTK